MRNPLKTERSTDIGLLLARIPLGVLFVIAGCNKFIGDGGISRFAADSANLVPGWVQKVEYSKPVMHYYLLSLPFLEVVGGLLIVLGLLTRLGGFIVSTLLVSIILATGSFRTHNVPHANIVYLSLALLFFFAGGGRISLDGLFWGKKAGGRGFPTD